MAERAAGSNQQNWEERQILSLGPNFRIDANNPQLGITGELVYSIYGTTDSDDQCFVGFSQGGHYRILNDRSIEITGGNKSEEEGVDIALNALKGSISLTCIGNGAVQLLAKNIVLEAYEDVDIIAGRNVNITAGSLIYLCAPKIEICEEALMGNLVSEVLGTFGARIFAGSPFLEAAGVGFDVIASSFTGGIGGAVGSVVGGLF